MNKLKLFGSIVAAVALYGAGCWSAKEAYEIDSIRKVTDEKQTVYHVRHDFAPSRVYVVTRHAGPDNAYDSGEIDLLPRNQYQKKNTKRSDAIKGFD